MPMTVEEGLALLGRKIAALHNAPGEVIVQAERELMPQVPVYTGTYRGAIRSEVDDEHATLYLSEANLQDSAALNTEGAGNWKGIWHIMSNYVYANLHHRPPEGPYPIRIEEYGRPSGRIPSGRNIWHALVERMRKTVPVTFYQHWRGVV